ncbi:hypothetical protein K1T71_000824 [Dendrolimus kikuchii]|uniref:Uncharacterized protein n=1 Tax=Dendrolimus kikuchii TaxID=765133 RepID=A0ACC1DKL3_9NEOP|nr:hypothetical protein K1T71_000824 [Dendrolimus kikuchii]
MAEPSGSGINTGVRLIVGKCLTDLRTVWVREVITGSRADIAGLKTGDCVLQADGKDLLGLPVGQVAGLIRGDGSGRGVSLLVWNCGVDPKDDPELLWSCGGGSRGEKSRRALSGVVKALSCCVCAATATKPLNCARSHLYCEACWTRLERCALCREQLPPKDSPYSKNLVAEQVFEAIATEYELKHSIRRPKETTSAYTSPNRSPVSSPTTSRKGQYQISMINHKKVQFNEKYRQTYGSDPNLHRSVNNSFLRYGTVHSNKDGGTNILNCRCQIKIENKSVHASCQTDFNDIPQISIENVDLNNKIQTCSDVNDKPCNTENSGNSSNMCYKETCHNQGIQHKLVTRLRQACSLADLHNTAVPSCQISRSLNNLEHCPGHHGSLENIKHRCHNACGMYNYFVIANVPVFLLPAPSIYVVTCDHQKE